MAMVNNKHDLYSIPLSGNIEPSVENMERLLCENVMAICRFFDMPDNELDVLDIRCYGPDNKRTESRHNPCRREAGVAIFGHVLDRKSLYLYKWDGRSAAEAAAANLPWLKFSWFPLGRHKKRVMVASIARKFDHARLSFAKGALSEMNETRAGRTFENVHKRFKNAELFRKDIYVMRDKVLSPEKCRFLIDVFERFGRCSATPHDTCSLSSLRVIDVEEKTSGCAGVDHTVYQAVRKIMLAIHFYLDMSMSSDDGYQIKKLSHYAWQPQPCSPNRGSRVNVIIQLNDVPGGEVMFPRQNAVAKLEEGDVVLFPNSWTHPFYHLFVEGGKSKYVCETTLS